MLDIYKEDLSVEEARAILRSADIRHYKKRAFSENYDWNYYEILYKDEWYGLARTDQADDVCTTRNWKFESEDEARKHFLYEAKLGVRIRISETHKTFAVIDSYSDG